MKQNSIRIDPQRSAAFPVDMEATLCSHRMTEGSRSSPEATSTESVGVGRQGSRVLPGEPRGQHRGSAAWRLPSWGTAYYPWTVLRSSCAEPCSQLQSSTLLVPHLVIELSPCPGFWLDTRPVHPWKTIAHTSHASAAVCLVCLC